MKDKSDKSGQQDKDAQEGGSGLKIAGPDGEITAGLLMKLYQLSFGSTRFIQI